MFVRGFQKQTIVEAVKNGDIIKEYPNDNPYPSFLLLAIINDKPIHVVLANNQIGNEVYIITVYVPDKELWTNDFKTRRK